MKTQQRPITSLDAGELLGARIRNMAAGLDNFPLINND
jgi:hypothetical protein